MTRMSVSQAYKTLWGTGIFFVIMPHLNLGLLSDYKICGDSGCESPMSRVLAIRDHDGKDCRFLSFRRGDTILVYHKLTGKREDLWAGSIDKQFGYFPKAAVQEKYVHARTEQIVETQESDFLCMDEFGYPIDSSHMDSDDDDEKIPNQESEITQPPPHTDNTNTENISKSNEADRTWTPESGGNKEARDAREAPAAPHEQGGSASSAWLGSSVTGWLGLPSVEEPGSLADGEKKAAMRGEEQHDDTVKSGEEEEEEEEEEETPHSFTSTVTGWLGFGEEKKTDNSEGKEQDEAREDDDDEEEPAEKFRSRRMSLNLEGSQLHEEEKEKMGTLVWLGKGLSDQLGFGLTNQDSGHETTAEREDKEAIQQEEEQPASGSWFDMGIGDILGFKKDKKEVEENTVRGFNEPEKHKITEDTAGSGNVNAGQSHAALAERGQTETSNEPEVEGSVKDQNVPSEEETVPDSADSVDSNNSTSDSSKDSVPTEDTASEDVSSQKKLEEKSQAVGGLSSMFNSFFQIGNEEEEEHEGLDDPTEEKKSLDEESSAEMEDEDHKRPKSTEDVSDDNNITETGELKTTEMESTDRSAKIGSSSDDHEGEGSNAEPGEFQSQISATQTDEKAEKSVIRGGAGESSGETQLFLSSDTDVERNQPASNQDDGAHSKETSADDSDPLAITDSDTEAETHQSELGPEGDVNALEEGFLEVGPSLSTNQSTAHRSADDKSQESPYMRQTEKDGPHKVEPVATEIERSETVTDTEGVEASKNEGEQSDIEELKDEEGAKALEQQQEVGEEQESKVEEKQTVVKKIEERGIQSEVEVEQEETLDEVEMRKGKKDQEEIKEGEKQGDEFKDEVEVEKESENEVTEQVGEGQFKEEEKQVEEEGKLKEEEKQQEVKDIEEEAKKVEEAQEAVEFIKDNKKQEEEKHQQADELKEETNEEEEELKEEDKQQEVKVIEEEAKKEQEAQEAVEFIKDNKKQEEEKHQQADELKEETNEEEEEELKEEDKQQEEAKKEQEAQEAVEFIKDDKKQEEIKEEEKQQQAEALKEETQEEEEEEEEEELREEEKQQVVKEIEKEGKVEETEEVKQEEVEMKEEKQEEEFKDEVELQTEGEKQAASEVVDELKEGKVDLKEVEEIKVKEEKVGEDTQVEMETSLRSSLDQEKETDRTESERNERETEGETSFQSDMQTEIQEEVKVREEMKGEEDGENLGHERRSKEEEEVNLKCSNEPFSKACPERFPGESGVENSGIKLSSTDEAELDAGKQNPMADHDQMLGDKTGVGQTALADGMERHEDGEQEEEKRNDDEDSEDGNEDDKSDTANSLSDLEALGVTPAERSSYADDHLLYSGESDPDKNDVLSGQRAENKEEEEDFNETKNSNLYEDNMLSQRDKSDPERPEKSSSGINAERKTEQIHITDTKEETDSDENRTNMRNDDVRVNAKSEQPDPNASQHPTSSSLRPDGHSNMAETERGGAFGLFQKAFSFFQQAPATKPTAPSSDVTTGETSAAHSSLGPEQEVDSTTDSAQVDIQDLPITTQQHLQTTPPPSTETSSLLAETLSHPTAASPTPGTPLQAKTLSKTYKSLLTYMSVEEKTILMELFGRHKLQFLDYILSSEMIDATDNDESILLDIERLLHLHKEMLAAQSVGHFDSPQEGKEKMHMALQKLEILLAGMRETFNAGRSVSNRQAEASNESREAGDSSVLLDHSTPRDEWTGLDVEKDGQLNRGGLAESPESHPQVHPEPPQPPDGTVKQMVDFFHQIAEDSITHVHAVRGVLVLLTIQSSQGHSRTSIKYQRDKEGSATSYLSPHQKRAH